MRRRLLPTTFLPATSGVAFALVLSLVGAPRAFAGDPVILDPTPPLDTWDRLADARILRVLRYAAPDTAGADFGRPGKPRVIAEVREVPTGWQQELVDRLSSAEDFWWRDERPALEAVRLVYPDLGVEMLAGSDTVRVTLDLRNDHAGALPLLEHTWVIFKEQHDQLLDLAWKLFPADTGLAGISKRGRKLAQQHVTRVPGAPPPPADAVPVEPDEVDGWGAHCSPDSQPVLVKAGPVPCWVLVPINFKLMP